MKVTARSRPAKGWPCLMKTDEAEIKCLPTLRDSFITVSPRATEHLGLELSFKQALPHSTLVARCSLSCHMNASIFLPLLPLFFFIYAALTENTDCIQFSSTPCVKSRVTSELLRKRGAAFRDLWQSLLWRGGGPPSLRPFGRVDPCGFNTAAEANSPPVEGAVFSSRCSSCPCNNESFRLCLKLLN